MTPEQIQRCAGSGLHLTRTVSVGNWLECEPPMRCYDNAYLREVSLGAYSYVSPFAAMVAVDVGRYCSIGNHVQIGSSVHPTDTLSTSPVFYQRVFPEQAWPASPETLPFKRVTLGHDVWVGAHARILPGVTVGHGAVIGMGAVVARDVPPYAVVVGNPGVVKKYRLPPELVEQALSLQWWEFDWPRCKAAESINARTPPAQALEIMRACIEGGQVERLKPRRVRLEA